MFILQYVMYFYNVSVYLIFTPYSHEKTLLLSQNLNREKIRVLWVLWVFPRFLASVPLCTRIGIYSYTTNC